MGKPNLKTAKRQQKSGGVVARTINIVMRLIAVTVRCRLHDESGRFTGPRTGAAIVCFWHNRLAICIKVRETYVNNRTDGNKMAALVSASRDGGLLARVLELFHIQAVRGSSSRRGPQALREMISWGERGYDLAITPDGPRGPCYRVADGVTSLAQLTGLPILPMAFNLNWKINLKSWDRFQIPLPFARCDVCVGAPITVSREATDAEREQIRQQLEAKLRELSRD
jgi:lysophospholipid acyltransferase (LPLAT)-like uncharacterized protein